MRSNSQTLSLRQTLTTLTFYNKKIISNELNTKEEIFLEFLTVVSVQRCIHLIREIRFPFSSNSQTLSPHFQNFHHTDFIIKT